MKKWAEANGIIVPSGQTPILVRVIDDYGGASRWISLKLDGVDPSAKPKCTLLDHRHDLTPCGLAFADGVLTLEKPDFFSAAFLVEFGRRP